MKKTPEKPALFPDNPLIVRAAIVSAKIEGIEINETQLQNAFERFREAILQNLKRNQALPQ